MPVRSIAPRRRVVTCLLCGAELSASQQRLSQGQCPYCRQTLQCEVRRWGGITFLHLRQGDNLDCPDSAHLCKMVDACEETRNLVVDMKGMAAVTSALLAGLITLKRKVEQAGGTVLLCGLEPVTRSIFETTRLNRHFEIVGTLVAAVRSVNQKRALANPEAANSNAVGIP